MNKIKVIFTGGTIGSLATGNDISPDSKTKYMLLENYGKDLDRFITSNPLFILSENANLANILQMAREITLAQQEEGLKGIIMTHGTDTLAFTSALLSFLVPQIKIPVVLVSSDYVLTDTKANGNINFRVAVELIDNENTLPAIYVAYKNENEDFTNIHLASRMREPSSYSNSFYSPFGTRFAVYKNGEFTFENTSINKSDKLFINNIFDGNITCTGLFIHPHTGLDYNNYKNIKSAFVLHDSYHSGTANTTDYVDNTFETNFLSFADYCKENSIPLYLCNIRKKDVNYNSTNQMLEKNIFPLYDIVTNVALAKLIVAYNFVDSNLREEFLQTSVAGEILK